MLGQLSSLRRRGLQLTQGLFLRSIATQKLGRRPPPAPPPPPPKREPPEKTEWWAVDGELFRAEEFDPKRIVAPRELEHISNKRRRKELIRHLKRTRLKFKFHSQETYWAAYMQRFRSLRDEWEKHVWDPIPVPRPKPRNPTWLSEETEKYVWKDPRREAYIVSRNAAQEAQSGAYTFDLSRLEQSAIRDKFDEKIGYKRQAMSHSPYEDRRNPGGLNAQRGRMPSISDFARRRNLRPAAIEDFDDVFISEDTGKNDGDETKDEGSSKSKSRIRNIASKAPKSSIEEEGDSEEVLFDWDETDSEEDNVSQSKAAGNNDDKEDDFSTNSESNRKMCWSEEEDDLFDDQ